jgi:hypothetical protein
MGDISKGVDKKKKYSKQKTGKRGVRLEELLIM